MRYKLRAECAGDVVCFNQIMGRQITSCKLLEHETLPDVEFEFETDIRFSDIKNAIGEIPDSHVMYQTVSQIDKYTGVRD